MNYSIKVNKLEKENWSTKAFVSVVFEESFKLTDITIRETKNGETFVAMPGYKTKRMNREIQFTKITFIQQQQSLERNCTITS